VNKKNTLKFNNDHGAAMMMFAVFVFLLSMTIIIGISRPAIREFSLTKNTLDSKQAYFLAESGVEDAFYRVKTGKNISASESLVLSSTTATTTITNLSSGDKEIESLSSTNSYQRKVNLLLTQGVGTSFYYGMHSGTGGVTMNNSSSIIGNLYSNGSISASSGSSITGSAVSAGSGGSINGANAGNDIQAHTVTNSTAVGTIYCQVGSLNNKLCDTSKIDPPTQPFPVTPSDISNWQTLASAGGTSFPISLSGSSTQSIGPKKILGNVTLSNNAVLTVDGTLWITGNLSISNNSIINLNSSFGSNGGVIVIDGIVSTSNSATFQGSGTLGSYIMVVSNSISNSAIQINNTAGSIVLVAPDGGVVLNNSAGANQVTAKTITLNNSATIIYQTGLASAAFSSGPSGAWNVKSWKEK
jgi:hypothetical protein